MPTLSTASTKSSPIIAKLDLPKALSLSKGQTDAIAVCRILATSYAKHALLTDGESKPAPLLTALARVSRADIARVQGAMPSLLALLRPIPADTGRSSYGADVESAGNAVVQRTLASILEGATKALAALKAHRLAMTPAAPATVVASASAA